MNITKWFRIYYSKITDSIAFYPAIIATCFLLLSWVMLEIDFSAWGKEFKSGLNWLSLKDASTARSIIATVAGAIISLTVFSFSMVMIVLNQAASQMSNRVLSGMIENRFQQIILGIYIGTIVYSLFLLTTIRDIDSGVYIPALSIYFLIFLMVIDIFLFIYFLDYVTQTVKYETVIHRVQKETMQTMKRKYKPCEEETATWNELPFIEIKTEESDYFQGFNEKRILQIARQKDCFVTFLYKKSSWLIKDIVFMKIYGKDIIDKTTQEELLAATDFYKGQPIDRNPDYGFNQLAEVAIKSLSPAINDPATAVISLQYLSDILSFKLYHNPPSLREDEDGVKRIYIPCSSFTDMFQKCIYPIWNYGKKDQYIQNEIINMIRQLKFADHKNLYTNLFDKLLMEVEYQIDNQRAS